MKRLKKILAALLTSQGRQEAFRDRAVRRMKARHAGQKKAERQAEAARHAADHLRTKGQIAKAERKDRKAGRLDVKADREKTQAIQFRAGSRKISKRLAGIKGDIEEIRQQIDQLEPKVEGNRVVGGDEFDRWLLCLNTMALNCSKGLPDGRRNFYSMSGSWNVDHPITPGEAYGERSDCSQTMTAAIKACGFPDINGEDFRGGFTGTMLRASGRWVEVSLEHMLKARRPAVIVYGGGVGHHTEGWCPSIDEAGNFIDAMRTVGHGSAPVDAGTVYLFGAGEVQRYFILAAE